MFNNIESIRDLYVNPDPAKNEQFLEIAIKDAKVREVYQEFLEKCQEDNETGLLIDNFELMTRMMDLKSRISEGAPAGDPLESSSASVGSVSSDQSLDPEMATESLKELMGLSGEDWRGHSDAVFNRKLVDYVKTYPVLTRPEEADKAAGFLVKIDVAEGTEFAVIGDIHGNDARLVQTLDQLQERGFLDENYRCKTGKQLIFLGDYVDRGVNSLKVIELLMALKNENGEQVQLLRGNHEDAEYAFGNLDLYTSNDPRYKNYLGDKENRNTIDAFYKSLPVAVYVGQKGVEGTKEYIQFSHGLFHLFADPAPLLDAEVDAALMWVDGAKEFSHRVRNLQSTSDEVLTEEQNQLQTAAKNIDTLAQKIFAKFKDILWLDVQKEPGFITDEFTGRTQIGPDFIEDYLNIISTPKAKVNEIIRGHQHGIWTVQGREEKTVVTTLDPSDMEKTQYFMELNVAPKTEEWERYLVYFPLYP